LAAAVIVAALASACGAVTTGTTVTTRSTGKPLGQDPVAPAVRLLASDGAAGDNLGGAIWYDTFHQPIKPVYYATAGEAALSSNGRVAIVGAPAHANGTKLGAGAAYVFAEHGGQWAQVATLVPDGVAAYDAFGWTVALSGDGHSAFVGAPYHDTVTKEDRGAAYFFHDSGGKWLQTGMVRPSEILGYYGFGTSVAFARDGNTVIVGVPGQKVGGTQGDGAAYIFGLVAGHWKYVNRIAPSVGEKNGSFGAFVALSADGSIAAVTRFSHFDGDRVYRRGATYIFRSTDSWKSSKQQAVFVDPNQNADHTTDAYGVNVVLSDDGKVAAVAAPDVNVGKYGGAGATYVYTTMGDWGTPSENSTTTLLPPVPVTFGYYGSTVALSSDGKILFIGVDGAGSNAQGEGYVVRPRTDAGPDRWKPESFVQTRVPPPHQAKGRFGTAVSMSADGTTLLGTSPWLDIGAKVQQGAAFIITLAPPR
jgi:hypothetical protein